MEVARIKGRHFGRFGSSLTRSTAMTAEQNAIVQPWPNLPAATQIKTPKWDRPLSPLPLTPAIPYNHCPSMKVRLSKTFGFEAAHDLPTFPEGHKCRRLHGHSYRFEVIVEGEVDPKPGYLLDYGEIKKVVDPIVRQLDHYYLNKISGLENSTSEILAGWLWTRIKPSLPLLAKIIVYETCTSACEYCGE